MDDINNILNSGEVPNLMQIDDLEEIYNYIRSIIKEKGLFETRELMNSLFI